MAILSIRLIGDPVLRTASEPVTDFDRSLAKLIADMDETMRDVEGAGLAAPQVGVNLRIFTYSAEGQSGHVVNPVLETGEEDQEGSEGCLSIPGLGFQTPRKAWARVSGQDQYGGPITVEGTGVLARALQHETDHLDGVLYVNRLTGEDRKEAMRSIRDRGFEQLSSSTHQQRARSVGSSFRVNS